MKVIVHQNDVVERKSYPYIGQNLEGVCVAFYAPKKGVVVANNDKVLNDYGLFAHREDFIEENFRKFEGEIILRN